jgi:hypothetical protein
MQFRLRHTPGIIMRTIARLFSLPRSLGVTPKPGGAGPGNGIITEDNLFIITEDNIYIVQE